MVRNYSECLSTYAGQSHKVYLAVNRTFAYNRGMCRISQLFTPNPGGVVTTPTLSIFRVCNCIIRTALAQRQTSRTNSSIPYTLESLFSERRCDREAESLARLPQKEISRQRLDRLLVGKIPCSSRLHD